jgi:hypothetical protein
VSLFTAPNIGTLRPGSVPAGLLAYQLSGADYGTAPIPSVAAVAASSPLCRLAQLLGSASLDPVPVFGVSPWPVSFSMITFHPYRNYLQSVFCDLVHFSCKSLECNDSFVVFLLVFGIVWGIVPDSFYALAGPFRTI